MLSNGISVSGSHCSHDSIKALGLVQGSGIHKYDDLLFGRGIEEVAHGRILSLRSGHLSEIPAAEKRYKFSFSGRALRRHSFLGVESLPMAYISARIVHSYEYRSGI
jgi:hypothetical protein